MEAALRSTPSSDTNLHMGGVFLPLSLLKVCSVGVHSTWGNQVMAWWGLNTDSDWHLAKVKLQTANPDFRQPQRFLKALLSYFYAPDNTRRITRQLAETLQSEVQSSPRFVLFFSFSPGNSIHFHHIGGGMDLREDRSAVTSLALCWLPGIQTC